MWERITLSSSGWSDNYNGRRKSSNLIMSVQMVCIWEFHKNMGSEDKLVI